MTVSASIRTAERPQSTPAVDATINPASSSCLPTPSPSGHQKCKLVADESDLSDIPESPKKTKKRSKNKASDSKKKQKTFEAHNNFTTIYSLPAVKGDSWEEFVAALIKIYPGARGDRKFSKNDLKLLVSRSSQVPMMDQVMLGEYYQSFISIVTFLEDKKQIYPSEVSEYFKGFHPQFHQQLIDQLEREHL
ncbi:hypothetical protein M413DRAFT_22982 [Hebeloma cylindrosporum]|uniref:Uncharacterized protein n=1 Tax=Hebeloma cylindrosporum TaxID=76867 RepID=A0A0C3CWI0_HEBCY|nr:hypothetical protein M413DRAFT_22982 [Hebeloma cylindrosporum h7]